MKKYKNKVRLLLCSMLISIMNITKPLIFMKRYRKGVYHAFVT